ncbi:MAG: spermidine synthase [Anaerolineae bacterium]
MTKNTYLLLTVFVSGMTTLGVELSASRLLEPFFGNSIIIWANLIGLVLIYLSAGYWLGGRWADRDPRGVTFFQIIAWGAFLVGLIPFAAAPILRWSVAGFAAFDAGILIGSFLGVLILFSLPMTLLGMASPFAIRLAVTDVAGSGRVAGSVYALSTLGSILGTFLPALVLIPNIGTRRTFILFSATLLCIAIGGLFRRSRRTGLLYLGLPVALALLLLFGSGGPIKGGETAIFETESRYNYIQVEKVGPDYLLRLNEGQGIHSVYTPGDPLAYGIWDYFLAAPYFNNPPFAEDRVGSLLLIGAAAGTIPRQYSAVYGPIPIDGVELDPAISRVGRRFFAMTEPNLTTINQDGRYFLANTPRRYDVIGVDAYRPPYIPFQLTTQEFFAQTAARLTDDGVVAINAGRSATDYSLVVALGSTMKTVFPSVYVIDTPDSGYDLGNSLVIATRRPTRLANLAENAARLNHPLLQNVTGRALTSRLWEITCAPGAPFVAGMGQLPPNLPDACPAPFTDDKAPVEQVVHALILRYLLGE